MSGNFHSFVQHAMGPNCAQCNRTLLDHPQYIPQNGTKMETFITKDSGERQHFSSGMVRDTTAGKRRWDLIASGPMMARWADLLTRGASKYDADNWMKANGKEEYDRFLESSYRHFMNWFYLRKFGIDFEPGEDHGAATFFNINGVEYVKGKLDDRSKP